MYTAIQMLEVSKIFILWKEIDTLIQHFFFP